jgi:hypothetical protein
MGRRKSSPWAPHRVALRVLFGPERNHPHPIRGLKRALGVGHIASASRNPRTGEVTSRGMRRTADGWKLDGSRRSRTYRAGETEPDRTKRSQARAAKRKSDRAGRTAPKAKASAAKPAADTNPNLARKTRRNADGTMAGSTSGIPKMPTPRKAVGLQRLGCDWCRGRGTRPLTQGKGRIKTVIGIAPCSHSWAVPNHGPGQNSLVCPPCENKGSVLVSVRQKSGRGVEVRVPCFTCKGWILHW